MYSQQLGNAPGSHKFGEHGMDNDRGFFPLDLTMGMRVRGSGIGVGALVIVLSYFGYVHLIQVKEAADSIRRVEIVVD